MAKNRADNNTKINQMSEDIAVIKSQMKPINSAFSPGGKFEEFCQLAIQNNNSIRWIKIIGSVALTAFAVFIPYMIATQ